MSQRCLVDFWLSQLMPFSVLEEPWNRTRVEEELSSVITPCIRCAFVITEWNRQLVIQCETAS